MTDEEREIQSLFLLGFLAGVHERGYGEGQSERVSASPHYQQGYRAGVRDAAVRRDNEFAWKAMYGGVTGALLRAYPGRFQQLRRDWQAAADEHYAPRRSSRTPRSKPKKRVYSQPGLYGVIAEVRR